MSIRFMADDPPTATARRQHSEDVSRPQPKGGFVRKALGCRLRHSALDDEGDGRVLQHLPRYALPRAAASAPAASL